MESMDLFCLGTTILGGLIYGIVGIVTQKTGWRDYEEKAAFSAEWQITLIFALFAIIFLYALLSAP